ncbi:MAG TPA: hypothetical protein VFQ69_12780 [Rhizomicrobium sp.]|nr:hypothetical protein [Rhizomicrobium sp.]
MDAIQEGFDVFLQDGEKSFGAVRQVRKGEIVVYVEAAGDFEVPLSAITAVHAQKVVLDGGRLAPKLMQAIRAAHNREDPTIP